MEALERLGTSPLESMKSLQGEISGL
jgi:hypothetical protein